MWAKTEQTPRRNNRGNLTLGNNFASNGEHKHKRNDCIVTEAQGFSNTSNLQTDLMADSNKATQRRFRMRSQLQPLASSPAIAAAAAAIAPAAAVSVAAPPPGPVGGKSRCARINSAGQVGPAGLMSFARSISY
jgi:hypothetical protein